MLITLDFRQTIPPLLTRVLPKLHSETSILTMGLGMGAEKLKLEQIASELAVSLLGKRKSVKFFKIIKKKAIRDTRIYKKNTL